MYGYTIHVIICTYYKNYKQLHNVVEVNEMTVGLGVVHKPFGQ